MIKVGSYHYWFGENRNADNTFRAVSAYRSSDLKTWEFRRDVLTRAGAPEPADANIERPKVIYNSTTGKFVMWMHKENGTDYTQARAAVAVSGTVDGDYRSQTTFVLPVQGSSGTAYLYMGDRWGNSMGGTVNDSQYVWLPLTFPTRTTMNLPWYPQTAVDTEAGTVTGAGGGPYYNLVARHSGKCLDVSDNSAADSAVTLQYTCIGGLNQQWRLKDAGNGYVQILAQHSGKCLDVANGSTADGAFVNQYRCTTGTNQQWQFQDQGGGYYRLVARHSGKCLDVADASTTNGARLIQWPCGTGAHQRSQRRAA